MDVAAGGTLNVSAGAAIIDTLVSGIDNISAGGTATGTTILEGGR